MIVGNTGPNGELDTDAFQRAMLTYRNTPDPETGISPAMCIFGRPTRSTIPILPGKYQPHPTWQDTLQKREEALKTRHFKIAERLSMGTRQIPPLQVGDHVRIQNQIGSNPRKWDKTGVVIEVKQHNQYVVRVDGSGRVTLRNRKFLRKFVPVIPSTNANSSPSVYSYLKHIYSDSTNHTPAPIPHIGDPTSPTITDEPLQDDSHHPPPIIVDAPFEQNSNTTPFVGSPPDAIPTPVPSPIPTPKTFKMSPTVIRKSTRQRKTPTYLADYEH